MVLMNEIASLQTVKRRVKVPVDNTLLRQNMLHFAYDKSPFNPGEHIQIHWQGVSLETDFRGGLVYATNRSGMGSLIRSLKLKKGDTLIFSEGEDFKFKVSVKRLRPGTAHPPVVPKQAPVQCR